MLIQQIDPFILLYILLKTEETIIQLYRFAPKDLKQLQNPKRTQKKNK